MGIEAHNPIITTTSRWYLRGSVSQSTFPKLKIIQHQSWRKVSYTGSCIILFLSWLYLYFETKYPQIYQSLFSLGWGLFRPKFSKYFDDTLEKYTLKTVYFSVMLESHQFWHLQSGDEIYLASERILYRTVKTVDIMTKTSHGQYILVSVRNCFSCLSRLRLLTLPQWVGDGLTQAKCLPPDSAGYES